jgi:biofilm PGA synthesis N-glycosyltransferase PgaC
MLTIETALLILLVLLFVYPFVGYPLLLRLQPKRTREAPAADQFPTVAIVICALNEARIIGEKVENSLALDYPKDKLLIVIVSDGSTDATAEIVGRYESGGVRLISQPVRRGKIANLNEVIPALEQQIVVLSDANVIYRRDAIRRLVSRFADQSVGCVSGRVILTDSAPALDQPTGDYYSVEWFLQEQASAIYSMAGTDGAMYALRRELYRPCPNDTLIEDFIIPMQILRQGKRVVLEPEAIGWERGASSLTEEYRRKVRIAAGAVQGLVRGNAWPANAPAQFWFVFLSHKLLRWLSPVTGLAAVALAAASWGNPLSEMVLAGFVLVSLLSIVRLALRLSHPLLNLPFYFTFGIVAMGIGLLKGATGTQTVLWAKANR